mmetsp:Transcript_4068/g.11230  ORF Transcript_4068/g.11230 Transcript_4068/m.11230 type:complete len:135 (-) Transcript_4068:402-806(-)|eukprot:scaffold113751_cov34-Tisochrysis_lutea.AAC.3
MDPCPCDAGVLCLTPAAGDRMARDDECVLKCSFGENESRGGDGGADQPAAMSQGPGVLGVSQESKAPVPPLSSGAGDASARDREARNVREKGSASAQHSPATTQVNGAPPGRSRCSRRRAIRSGSSHHAPQAAH